MSFNATTRVATLNPTGNLLLAGAPYTARVRGGATDPRVKDLAGNALAADRVWSFSVETKAPTVSSTSPANGATGVSRTANITVTFNEAVDPATVSGSTFELRDAAGALVSAVVTLNSTGRTATLNPKTGRMNKPKTSTYCEVVVLALDEESGYVQHDELIIYSDEKQIEEFKAKYELNDFQMNFINKKLK